MEIKYEDVPHGYTHCISTRCPLAGNCLRAMAWAALPQDVSQVPVLNPAVTTESDGCAYFRDSSPVKYALGFKDMQKRMFPAQYDQFSAILKAKFGRNPYFERRMGKRPMPPAEQALVLQALATVGIKEPLDFDGFQEDILW